MACKMTSGIQSPFKPPDRAEDKYVGQLSMTFGIHNDILIYQEVAKGLQSLVINLYLDIIIDV